MIAKLIVASGKSAGRTIAIKRNKLLIGRAEECDVRPLSEDVSRRHCGVIVGPADVWVEDLGSRNGTFVNGNRITGKIRVVDGDVIRVGALELKVSCADPAARGGSEDDVSRWLVTDERPAGMFDTTQTFPAADPDATQISSASGAAAPAHGRDEKTESAPLAAVSKNGTATAGVAASETAPVHAEAAGRSSAALAVEALKASKSTPGLLPQAQQKKKSDSSRDAAADALKRFFENR